MSKWHKNSLKEEKRKKLSQHALDGQEKNKLNKRQTVAAPDLKGDECSVVVVFLQMKCIRDEGE